MAGFNSVELFDGVSLSDLFKQIHKNNKNNEKQLKEFIEALKPLASDSAGAAIQLMPTVVELIDVSVKNTDQLIKMAAIVQRSSISRNSNSSSDIIDLDELQMLVEEQKQLQDEGQKILDISKKDSTKLIG